MLRNFNGKGFTVLIALILFSGCLHVPCSLTTDLEPVNEKLSSEAMVGIYKFETLSLKYAIDDAAKSSQLILKADGTLCIAKFPTKIFTHVVYDVESYKFTDAEGFWEIKEEKGQQTVALDIDFDKKFNGIRSASTWDIYKKDDATLLYYIFGDPDACSVARLVKVE